MNELVEKIRKHTTPFCGCHACYCRQEAAAEIERLEKRLTVAINELAEDTNYQALLAEYERLKSELAAVKGCDGGSFDTLKRIAKLLDCGAFHAPCAIEKLKCERADALAAARSMEEEVRAWNWKHQLQAEDIALLQKKVEEHKDAFLKQVTENQKLMDDMKELEEKCKSLTHQLAQAKVREGIVTESRDKAEVRELEVARRARRAEAKVVKLEDEVATIRSANEVINAMRAKDVAMLTGYRTAVQAFLNNRLHGGWCPLCPGGSDGHAPTCHVGILESEVEKLEVK
jgi:DNA repair exonuclease SbcCD ATPase subunit